LALFLFQIDFFFNWYTMNATNPPISPKTWYAERLTQAGFMKDEAQAQAIEQLDSLWHALIHFKKQRNRFFGRSFRQPAPPKGLYLWGGVGRGKSLLMDAFYETVPYQRKRRQHFHVFMNEVHQRLKSVAGQADPLMVLAHQLSKEVRLLCFDEFHVSQIADAMILGRLMPALLAQGVVLVMTSNYEPDRLYPDGLHRESFLPAIAQLKTHLQVLNVDGGHDYRLRELTREALYLMPADAEALEKMRTRFEALQGATPELAHDITILGRTLPVRRHAAGLIWFDFEVLCRGARAQTDYLCLAQQYHTVFLSGVPQLQATDANEARRLTWLVDVFYDHRVKLVMSADVDVDQLYLQGTQASEFFRTASRLTEMQSAEYLAEAHLTDVR
jgi:cell division protein ZapE